MNKKILSMMLCFLLLFSSWPVAAEENAPNSYDTSQLIKSLGMYSGEQPIGETETEFSSGKLVIDLEYSKPDQGPVLKDGDALEIKLVPEDYSKSFLRADYTFSQQKEISIKKEGAVIKIADLDMTARDGAKLKFTNMADIDNFKIHLAIPFEIDASDTYYYFKKHKDEKQVNANFQIKVNGKIDKTVHFIFKKQESVLKKPKSPFEKSNGQKGSDILYNLFLTTLLTRPNEMIIYDTPDVNHSIEGSVKFFFPNTRGGLINHLFTAINNSATYEAQDSGDGYPLKIQVWDIYYKTEKGQAVYKPIDKTPLITKKVEGIFDGVSGKPVNTPQNIILEKPYGSILSSEEEENIKEAGGLYKSVAKGIRINIQNFRNEDFPAGGYMTVVYSTKVRNQSQEKDEKGPIYRNSFSYYGQEIPTCDPEKDKKCIPIKFEESSGDSIGHSEAGSIFADGKFTINKSLPIEGDLLANGNTEHDEIFTLENKEKQVDFRVDFSPKINEQLMNDKDITKSINSLTLKNQNPFIVSLILPESMSFSENPEIVLNQKEKLYGIDASKVKKDGQKITIPLKFKEGIDLSQYTSFKAFLEAYLKNPFSVTVEGNTFNNEAQPHTNYVAKAKVIMNLTGTYNGSDTFQFTGEAVQTKDGADCQNPTGKEIQLTLNYSGESPTPPTPQPEPTPVPDPVPTPVPEPKPQPKPNKPHHSHGGHSSAVKNPVLKPVTGNKLNLKEHYAYMFGYPDWTFRTQRPMTRAEVAAMFSRLMNYQPAETKVYPEEFPDVKASDWFFRAVEFMKEEGIVRGYPDGLFRPNHSITRAEFAAMAANFDHLLEKSAQSFADVPKTHWAEPYISSAVQRGWVHGYPDGLFRPEQAITRAEIVTVTNLMLNREADANFVKQHQAELIVFTDLKESDWAYYNIREATDGHEFTRQSNGRSEDWHELNHREFRFPKIGYRTAS